MVSSSTNLGTSLVSLDRGSLAGFPSVESIHLLGRGADPIEEAGIAKAPFHIPPSEYLSLKYSLCEKLSCQ